MASLFGTVCRLHYFYKNLLQNAYKLATRKYLFSTAWRPMPDQGSLVGPCMRDYKSLCAAVAISSTLVNTQTDTQTDSNQISSATGILQDFGHGV